VHGIAGDEGGEGGGEAERVIAGADAWMPLNEARLLHKPRPPLVGGLEHQRNLVEQVEGDRGGGGILREALEKGERTLLGRESGESLKRIGGRADQ
jgi:hypothetical protein